MEDGVQICAARSVSIGIRISVPFRKFVEQHYGLSIQAAPIKVCRGKALPTAFYSWATAIKFVFLRYGPQRGALAGPSLSSSYVDLDYRGGL